MNIFFPLILLLGLSLGSPSGLTPAMAEPLTSTEERLVHDGDSIRATIGLGQINRIVLPYEEPEVRTLNSATTELKGRVLYIAPEAEGEIQLLVADARSDTRGLSLSLKPEGSSPRTLTLRLDDSTPPPLAAAPGVSQSDFAATPRGIESLPKEVLKTLARGTLPEGYRRRAPGRSERIKCKRLPLEIRTRSVLEGPGQRILMGVAVNKGPHPVQMDEALCGDLPGVTAVASYPAGLLGPGGRLELFVILDLEARESGPKNQLARLASHP